MSKIKSGGLDQYGAEPFEQQQFGTAGVEGVNGQVKYTSLFIRALLKSLFCRRPVAYAQSDVRLETFEVWIRRRVLKISWTEHKT